MDKHKIIAALRAKAESTTFPEEASSLRARADKLEAKYGAAPNNPWRGPPPMGFGSPGQRAQPTGFTIHDLNEMMRSMSFGRPMQGGILIINGNVIRIDGVADNYNGGQWTRTTDFTNPFRDGNVQVTFEQGAQENGVEE